MLHQVSMGADMLGSGLCPTQTTTSCTIGLHVSIHSSSGAPFPGLLLGVEAPVMIPNGVDLSFLSG